MRLKEILTLADKQDEYLITFANSKSQFTIKNPDNIPAEFEEREITGIYGYNADGYDGLQITIN